MKAVLMSIQPKWCELIASGKKTVEVRKTQPKLEVPFKVYIYETKDKRYENIGVCGWKKDGTKYIFKNHCGKVIGEFVCDAIFPLSCYYSDTNAWFVHSEQPFTCLTDKEMIDYLGNGVEGYGWHITDLVIHDEPRELGEFVYSSTIYKKVFGDNRRVTRPPQSWCYVEEVTND